jgi:hypothetical protein
MRRNGLHRAAATALVLPMLLGAGSSCQDGKSITITPGRPPSVPPIVEESAPGVPGRCPNVWAQVRQQSATQIVGVFSWQCTPGIVIDAVVVLSLSDPVTYADLFRVSGHANSVADSSPFTLTGACKPGIWSFTVVGDAIDADGAKLTIRERSTMHVERC